MSKTNYVIATWTGKRRKGNDPHTRDTTYYVREHLETLKHLKHDLSQITVVAPTFVGEPLKVTQYLESLDGLIVGNTPVVLMRRENRGHSYGSYSHVFDRYRSNFDYYFFVEDDYVFAQDHFDTVMISLYEQKQCGFLCCLVTRFGQTATDPGLLHAAISNGLASAKSLQKVWDLKGELPSSAFTTKYHCQSQIQFSQGFIEAGLTLCDFTEHYSVLFNNTGILESYGRGKLMMRPLQFNGM